MIEPIPTDVRLDHYSRVIYRTCRHHTHNEDNAWEAFQETFLALTRRRDELDYSTDPEPWLRETARRCCLAVQRKNSRSKSIDPVHASDMLTSDDSPQIATAERNEAASAVQDELKQMSTEHQEVLRLIYVDGLNHKLVAKHMGCPSGSVHAKADQARQELRRRLRRRGLAVSMLLLLFLLQGETEAALPPVVERRLVSQTPPRIRRTLPWQLLTLPTLFFAAIAVNADYYLTSDAAAASATVSEEQQDTAVVSTDAQAHGCSCSL